MIYFEGALFAVAWLALGLLPQQLIIGIRGLKKLSAPSRCSLMGGCLQAGLEDVIDGDPPRQDAESSRDNNAAGQIKAPTTPNTRQPRGSNI